MRSRNHFEPNCKSRVVDEGKTLLILSSRFTTVRRNRGGRGDGSNLNWVFFLCVCRLCLCEWQTLAFPLARRFCFQLGDPRCAAKCGKPLPEHVSSSGPQTYRQHSQNCIKISCGEIYFMSVLCFFSTCVKICFPLL